MTFHVGQPVRCVDDSEWEKVGTIKKGATYTVKSVAVLHNTISLHLNEVVSVCGVPYYGWRFRPLIERKTDISCFTALLNPSRQKERV